jgi:hypothetical protein
MANYLIFNQKIKKARHGEYPTGCLGKNRDDGLEFNDKQLKNAVLASTSEAISLWWPITHHASTPGIPTRIPTTTGSSLRAPTSEAISLWRPITHHASTPGIPTRIPTTTGSSSWRNEAISELCQSTPISIFVASIPPA